MCYKKAKRYLKKDALSKVKLLGDIVIYTTEDPIVCMAKILAQPPLVQTYLQHP